MFLKLAIIILVFFTLALLQTNFFPYFSILKTVPNLIFVLFFILIFFEKPGEYFQGIFSVIIAGFLMDATSLFYFGISIISLLIIYIFKNITFYFLKEIQYQYLILYFIPMFSISFFLHNVILYLFSAIFNFSFNFELSILVSLAYSLIFALAGFYIQKYFSDKEVKDSQLKLFR